MDKEKIEMMNREAREKAKDILIYYVINNDKGLSIQVVDAKLWKHPISGRALFSTENKDGSTSIHHNYIPVVERVVWSIGLNKVGVWFNYENATYEDALNLISEYLDEKRTEYLNISNKYTAWLSEVDQQLEEHISELNGWGKDYES